MRKTAIIVDLDGTLYNSEERQKRCFPEGGKKDFDRWNQEAEQDPLNSWCASLVHGMRHLGFQIIFVSGRDGAYEGGVHRWMKKKLNMGPDDYLLFMRKTDDYRKDSVIKKELFHKVIEPEFQVLWAVDDRKQVVDMWRSLGLVCLQCAEGDF